MPSNPTIVFAGPRQVVVEDRAVPEPGPGQVLVRTACSLISTGTELGVLEGGAAAGSLWEQIAKYPFVPGYNNIGRVVSVGEGVDEVVIGQRFASYGPHTLYHTQKAGDLRPIQRTIPDEQAVFSTTAEIVMNGVRRSGLRWGESAVVFGLGLLGQLTVRLCCIAGARPVFGVDVSPLRLGMLPQEAAVVGIDARDADVATTIFRGTRRRKADVAFELTGNASAIPSQLAALRNQGRFVILSSPRGTTSFDFHDLCNAPSFTIIGAHNFSHPKFATPENPWTFQRDAELFFDYVADGQLDMLPLITHRRSFAQAPETYAMLLEDRTQAMGVVVEWEDEVESRSNENLQAPR